jgi:uncharacterized protein (TIGR02145 family)
LAPCTTYFIRAYAKNSRGVGYGNQLEVKTRGSLLTVQTSPITNIGSGNAKSGGSVSGVGELAIISGGVCWSTVPNPTADLSTKTQDGTTGNFASNIPGLQPATTYYARAYSTNCEGVFYGNEVSFTTLTVPSVIIGTQVWMAKNLDVDQYRDGTSIPTNLTNAEWVVATAGAGADYNNDPAFGAIYGKLYNWYAVSDPRGMCPIGFHIPSAVEWDLLISYLGGASVGGGALKEMGTAHWVSPNNGATNSSGFQALPGGSRYPADGVFANLASNGGVWALWWTTTPENGGGRYKGVVGSDPAVYGGNSPKNTGFSVRCLKD